MATPKKSSGLRRPKPTAKEGVPDAPSPTTVSGAAAPLRVVPTPPLPDPEVPERAARRWFTADYKLRVLRDELKIFVACSRRAGERSGGVPGGPA